MPQNRQPASSTASPEYFYSVEDPVPAASIIPRPPHGFPKGAASLRGVKPRSAELNLLAGALRELRAFSNYAEVFGTTAPPYKTMLSALERAEQWSAMRVALANWDDFCASMEGMAWRESRRGLGRLRPSYKLASIADATFPATHPNLTLLVGAMSAIVRKGVATKKANTKAIAEGREPLRGKALRAARRAAEKEALAEAQKAEKAQKAAKTKTKKA